MGGINCDASDPVIISAPSKMTQHLDSAEYCSACANLAKALFEANRNFFGLQSSIEDICLAETNKLQSLTVLCDILLQTSSTFSSSVSTLERANSEVAESARINFSKENVAQFMASSYQKAVDAGVIKVALDAGLIPNLSRPKPVESVLSEGAEAAFFDFAAPRISELRQQAEKLDSELRKAVKSVPNFQISIRELLNPISPLSMWIATCLTEMMDAQLRWAVLNMATLPSLNGVDTPIEKMVDSSSPAKY